MKPSIGAEPSSGEARSPRQGQTLLVTMMYSSRGVSAEAAKLLDWGFANADVLAPIGVLVDPMPEPTPSPPLPETVAAVAASTGEDIGGPTGRTTLVVVPLLVLAAGAASTVWLRRLHTACRLRP